MSYLGKEFTSISSLKENITLETAKILFSPNLKFSVLYSPSVILYLDLNTKEITSKVVFNSDERISNVKITQWNSLTYIKETKSNLIEIVTLNFNDHFEYFELKLHQRIFEYDSWLKGGIHYFIVITANYELLLYEDNLLCIGQNIANDFKMDNSYQYKNSIIKIEYVESYELLLIITSKGALLVYSIIDESPTRQFCLIEIHQIASKHTGSIDIDIVSVKQIPFTCVNNSLFLSIMSTLNKKDSVMSFFEIHNTRLVKLKEFILRHKICLDLYISPDLIDNIENKTNIYKYLFICIKTSEAIEFWYMDLFDCFGKKIKQQNEQSLLYYFNHLMGDISTIHKIAFINFSITQNKQGLMNSRNVNKPSINLCSLVKLNIKVFRIINEYECYLTNEIVSERIASQSQQEQYEEEEEDDIFKEALSTNVNQYLNFFLREKNSMNNMALYKEKVIHLVSQEKLLNDPLNSSFNPSNVDPYLMFLIYNNCFLAIKKYLNTKDHLNYNQFIVSNDVLFKTIRTIYINCRKTINSLIKRNDDVKEKESILHKAIIYLKLLIEVMKLIRHKNAHPINEPYAEENDIQKNEACTIDLYLFDMEVVLMIIKIAKECLSNKIDTEKLITIDTDLGYIKILNLNNSSDEKQSNTMISLNNLFVLYIERMTLEIESENDIKSSISNSISSSLKGFIYYMKFMFFNFYFYLVSATLNSLNDNIKQYFEGVEKEYEEYFNISQQFTLLDFENNERSFNSFLVINQFLIKLNQLDLIHNRGFKQLLSKSIPINALIIEKMVFDGFIADAYTLSQSLSDYYTEDSEQLSHLKVLLKLNLFNLAWKIITNLISEIDTNSIEIKSSSESNINQLISLPEHSFIKLMHCSFFKYLIENECLDILFTLPLTDFQVFLLKNFLLESREYEELLIIYYAKCRNGEEADKCFKDYLKKSYFGNEQSKELYKHLIDCLYYLFGNENQKSQVTDAADDFIRDIKVDNKAFYIECDVNKERHCLNSVNNNSSQINWKQESILISESMNKEDMDMDMDIKGSYIIKNKEEMIESMHHSMKSPMHISSQLELGKHYMHSSCSPIKTQTYSVHLKK